jgi:DNA-binding GntR family transcriptional regulator
MAHLAAEAKRLDRMIAGRDPRSRFGRQAHLEFHVSIARAGGYRRLAEELERVWFRRLMWMNWVKATHCRPVPQGWHQRLVEVLATRDAEQAEAQMRAHVRYGCEDDRAALAYLLQEQPGGDLSR